MKLFVQKLIAYVALLLALFCCSVLITFLSFKRIQSMSFKIDGDTIIVGHSMLECAIDDTKLTGCFNWSNSGESHFISFYKIRRLLEENRQIKYVVCAFSPWGDPEVMKWENDYCFGLGAILPFLNVVDFRDLPSFRILAWEKAIKDYWTMQLRHLTRPIPLSYWGKHAQLERCGVDQDTRYIEKKMLCKKDGFGPSLYIRRIQELCDAHGAKMILLYTPVYEKERWFSDVSWIHDEFFEDILFWDYSTLKLPKDHFADINHLNTRGSKIFTEMFGKRLAEMKVIGGANGKSTGDSASK